MGLPPELDRTGTIGCIRRSESACGGGRYRMNSIVSSCVSLDKVQIFTMLAYLITRVDIGRSDSQKTSEKEAKLYVF